ncbi:nuclear transport factor 2 family protein [Mycobacterium sp. BMJ-28]
MAEGNRTIGAVVDDSSAARDVVSRFLAAVAAGDTDAVIDTMAPDAQMITPLSGRAVIRGHSDLRVVFDALLPALAANLQWRSRFGPNGAGATIAIADTRLAGVRVHDAMLIEQDGDGRIRRVTPHVRPLLGLFASALILGPKLIRHPGVLRRALGQS